MTHTELHALIDSLSADEQAIALSALQTLQNRERTHSGAFTHLLGIHFEENDTGLLVGTLAVKAHHLNRHQIAHGGVPYTLADTTCGLAAIKTLGRPGVVTQDLHYRYHGPARLGTIRAEAETIHFGSRTIVTRGLVYQERVLIGSATATFAIIADDYFKEI